MTTYGLAFLAVLLAGPASAEKRLDAFGPDGKREGYAILDERTGRVDFYDVNSRRTGFGHVTPGGEVERFRLGGRRLETIRPWPWPP